MHITPSIAINEPKITRNALFWLTRYCVSACTSNPHSFKLGNLADFAVDTESCLAPDFLDRVLINNADRHPARLAVSAALLRLAERSCPFH